LSYNCFTGERDPTPDQRAHNCRSDLGRGAAESGNLASVDDAILAEQIAFYRVAASDYNYERVDPGFDLAGLDGLLTAIDAFRPTGDVLELACGTGVWTQHLARSATAVTAVDAAPEMLALARARDGNESVRFIEADLFTWRSDRRYDAVFFAFWVSHVPDEQFDSFWSLVDDCLRPGGQVFFCDDNYRAEDELIEGRSSPIVQRQTGDGTLFRIIKVPFKPDELESRLRASGWDITVTPTIGPFYWGAGGRDATRGKSAP
jgi:demethylmenaquinone methyltransferase/2-methoxy-6-polyprenyl-1,4-benzoquinol methylase